MLVQNQFLVQSIFVIEKFGSQNYWIEKFLAEKFFGQKNFWSKKLLVKKNFDRKNYLVDKIKKYFVDKNISPLKKCC